MTKLRYVLPAFILLAFIQWLIPSKIIFDNNDILKNGRLVKFKCAPVDPSDPFRGKSLTLRFDSSFCKVRNAKEWKNDEKIFVQLHIDEEGYAHVTGLSKEQPKGNTEYVTAKTQKYSSYYDSTLYFVYPFESYYLEESKSQVAGELYQESVNDSGQVTYGLVAIKEGNAVLKDVMINDVSIHKIIADKIKK